MIHPSTTSQSSFLSLLCLLPSLLLLASSQVSGIETCQQDDEQPLEFRFFTDNNSWNDNGWTLECAYDDETKALVWEVPVGSLKYEARTQVIREAACVPDTATCTLRIFDASGDGLQSSVLPTDANGIPLPINPLSDDIPESFSGWFAFLHGSTTVGTYQNVKWPNFSELTYCVGPNCSEENQEQDASSPQLSNNDENCQDIVYLAMQLDAQPQDTSYQLVCNNGVDIIWDGRDFTEAGSYVEEETCLPKDACCEFIITDTETNGLTSALDTTQLLVGTTTQRSTGFVYLEWNFEPILEYDGATGEQFDVLTASFACGASTSGTTDVEATTMTTTITETVDIDNGTETITKTESNTNTNTNTETTDAEADTVTDPTTETETENNDGNDNDPENDTDAAATTTEEMKLSNDMTETETATTEEEPDQMMMPYWEDPDWERRSQTAVPTDYFTNNGEWDRNDDDESWEYVRQETFSPTAWATFSSDDTAHSNVYWGDDDAGSEDDDFTAKAWEDEAVSWSSSSSDEDDQVMEDDDFTNAYVGYDDEVTMTTEAPYVGYDDVVQEQLQELEELVIAADGTITQEPEDEPNRKVEPEQFVMGSSNNSNLIVEKNNKKKNGISKGGKIATGIIGGLILLLGLAVLVIYFFGERLFGKYLYDSDSDDSDGIIKDHDTLEFSSDQHSKEDDIVDGVDEYLQTV
mmetsp:Transcript_48362/g.54824  ORF Transcript_48362/g.54824 Transcript_48362/m.54824 type:complete len:695 (-) Transcript_48362:14-2098(-)